MNTKLRVGNIGLGIDDNGLKGMFSALGTVISAAIQVSNLSGKSRGFGFVEMSNRQEADVCIQQLNGKDLGGKDILVTEAPPTAKKRVSR